MLLISIMFGSVIGSSIDIVRLAQNCSCWCLPVFGNSLPSARARDQVSQYMLAVIGTYSHNEMRSVCSL